MKKKMTAKDAEIYIYEMWQNRKLPADFTDQHPRYAEMLSLVLTKGTLQKEDLAALEIFNKEEE